MAVQNQVLIEFAPTLTPTRIQFLDLESKESANKIADPSGFGFKQQAGKDSPIIQINKTVIGKEDILSFTILQNEFLPQMQLSFVDRSFVMTSAAFPHITPIVSVYLAPTNRKLKSVACDFLITGIRSMQLSPTEIRYDYTGELYVPGINSNKSKSYPKMASVDVLRAVAKELGLGFATNEEKTNDTMTWINPNHNYKTFINQVVDRAYKSEKAFFSCFIDRNYVLNFINVERQFARDKEIDVTYFGTDTSKFESNRFDRFDNDDEIFETPMILTNAKADGVSDMSILEYLPISENGDVLRIESFKKRVKWYAHDDKLLDFFVEPISDKVAEGSTVHQTPELTDFTQSEVVKWIGIDYNNAHSNYKFARVINMHNEKELEKNMLKVVLHGVNFSVPRGSRVKVNIFNDAYSAITLAAQDTDDERNPLKDKNGKTPTGMMGEYLDERLSDFYYVKDVISRYRAFQGSTQLMSTEMILSKRNWQPAPTKQIE